MDPQKFSDPEAVRIAVREFDELGRTAFLEKYGFARSKSYMLRDESTGNLYDARAVLGAAYGYAFPDIGPLSTSDVPADEADTQRTLSELGFEVVRVGENWTREEVEITVRDYFQMLELESSGRPYNKREHNARLQARLKIRSRASIELKHQNISAVLAQIGLPFIRGYKPRTNLQELLREVVLGYVVAKNAEVARLLDNIEAQTIAPTPMYRGVLMMPPKVEVRPLTTKKTRLPRKLDYADRDERNRQLGRNGESWVVQFERTRLNDEARPDLAAEIDWLSERLGDGAGYDIMSFEASGAARFIEVKTTNGGPETPFIVSRNEKEFSADVGDAFCLYRVFNFAISPKLFIVRGSLADNFVLDAMDYRARLRAAS